VFGNVETIDYFLLPIIITQWFQRSTEGLNLNNPRQENLRFSQSWA